ncbi:MAG: amidohydrolase family protein [Rubrobacteraceae bacterium]|nr:amidohydrolase family protein [Rubrobacteraceae bacterium]
MVPSFAVRPPHLFRCEFSGLISHVWALSGHVSTRNSHRKPSSALIAAFGSERLLYGSDYCWPELFMNASKGQRKSVP